MDLGSVGRIDFTWQFAMGIFSIVVIDLVLAGDNAVIIAMAVKNLPRKTRTLGILIGSGCAVILRIACTFVVAQLLAIQYVKLAGGAVIIWIAVKLLVENAEEEGLHKEAATLLHALWIIMVADISMSVDNMLAVAAASKGNLFLLIFGLGLSIPFVVFTSTLLSLLMQKYPIIVYIGAALLGKVGGEMMITDPFILNLLHPSKVAEYAVMAFFTIGVLACSRIIIRRQVAGAREKAAQAAGAKHEEPSPGKTD